MKMIFDKMGYTETQVNYDKKSYPNIITQVNIYIRLE